MGVVTFSPLASGFLTGKYDAGIPTGSRISRFDWLKEWLYNEENLNRMRNFKKLAIESGYKRTQLAIAWVAAQPRVASVILGATSVDQLKQNLGAMAIEITAAIDQRLKNIFPIK